DQVWECVESNGFFSDVRQVVETGVWENAIYTDGSETGYTDALGSNHGWELYTNMKMFVDGKEIQPNNSDFIEARGSNFTAIATSNFVTVDNSEIRGVTMKKWRVTEGKVVIENDID